MISRNSIGGAFPITRLGEAVEFLDSKRRPVTESERRAGPFPYFGANGQQGTIDDYIFDEPLVLLAEDGGHFGEPAREIAYRISGKTWVNNHAHVLRPNPDVDIAFLCRVLEHYDVTPFVTGTTRGKLTKAGASEIVIPLPSLGEQRRIAEVLDRAEALRAKRRAALAQLDTLTQALFLDLFGDPATNPKGWPRVKLGDAILSASDGPHVSPHYSDTGVPFLSTRHVRAGEIIWEDLKFISREDAEVHWRKCKPERGDILYTKGGTTGLAVMVATDTPFAVWVHVALLKPSPDKVDSRWLESMLNCEFCYRQSQELTHGIANRDLGLTRMIKINMFLPPVELQRDFAHRIAIVSKLKDAHRSSLVDLDALFASLQHRAFRGEL